MSWSCVCAASIRGQELRPGSKRSGARGPVACWRAGRRRNAQGRAGRATSSRDCLSPGSVPAPIGYTASWRIAVATAPERKDRRCVAVDSRAISYHLPKRASAPLSNLMLWASSQGLRTGSRSCVARHAYRASDTSGHRVNCTWFKLDRNGRSDDARAPASPVRDGGRHAAVQSQPYRLRCRRHVYVATAMEAPAARDKSIAGSTSRRRVQPQEALPNVHTIAVAIAHR